MKSCHLIDLQTSPEVKDLTSDLTNSGSDLSAHTPAVNDSLLTSNDVMVTDGHTCDGETGAFFVQFKVCLKRSAVRCSYSFRTDVCPRS